MHRSEIKTYFDHESLCYSAALWLISEACELLCRLECVNSDKQTAPLLCETSASSLRCVITDDEELAVGHICSPHPGAFTSHTLALCIQHTYIHTYVQHTACWCSSVLHKHRVKRSQNMLN